MQSISKTSLQEWPMRPVAEREICDVTAAGRVLVLATIPPLAM